MRLKMSVMFPGRDKECQTRPEPSTAGDRGWHTCPKANPRASLRSQRAVRTGKQQVHTAQQPLRWGSLTSRHHRAGPPRPADWDTMGIGLGNVGLTSPPGASDVCLNWTPPALGSLAWCAGCCYLALECLGAGIGHQCDDPH